MRSWFALVLLAIGVVTLVVGPPVVRVLIAGAMLLAPGWLLWTWLGRDVRVPPLASIGLIIGISLSVIPLAFLWLNTLQIALPTVVLRLAFGILSGVAVWLLARGPRQGHATPTRARRAIPPWLLVGIGTLVVATFGLRLYQIRGLVLPLWVDSVHHALLIRIVGETGRIPTTLQPYVEVDHLVYHWGYHVVAATWRALTNLPIPTLMLLAGQLISAIHVIGAYTLGAYLARSSLAGLFAGLIVGLLSLMPAYYVTWGRYTQLTGLLLLPALIVLSCVVVEQPRLSRRTLALAALTVAGLIVIHYRVMVFYVAFMLPWTIFYGISHPRRTVVALGRLALLAVLGMVFAAPWVYEIGREVLVPLAKAPGGLAGADNYNSIDQTLLWTTNSYGIFAVAACGILAALLLRRWRVLVVAAWVTTMALIANPNVVGLPASWFINNHSVLITLFLPVSVLAGFGARQIIALVARFTPQRWRHGLQLAVVCAVTVLGARGLWQFRDVVNQGTNFAAAADLPALQWAEANTPRDARFLINAAPWLNQAYRGTDAGWWLLPLDGRWTSTPPSLYDYGSPDYVTAVAQRSEEVASLQPSDEAKLDALVRRNDIDYIFIGAKGGPIKSDMLWGKPEYEAVYDQDGVTIFAVRP